MGLGWLNAVQNASDIASGIVSHVTQTAVTVAFNETADSLSFDDEGPFKLVKLANDVTHKRIKRFDYKENIKHNFIYPVNTVSFSFLKLYL